MYSLHTALNLLQCTGLVQGFPLSRDGRSPITEKHHFMFDLIYQAIHGICTSQSFNVLL